MRYPKEYTVKEWKKFDRYVTKEINGVKYYKNIQELMCMRYDIILVDHQTKKEKASAILDKFNVENLNKGITKFNKGVDQIVKMTAAPKVKKKKQSFGITQKEYESVFGPVKGGRFF